MMLFALLYVAIGVYLAARASDKLKNPSPLTITMIYSSFLLTWPLIIYLGMRKQ